MKAGDKTVRDARIVGRVWLCPTNFSSDRQPKSAPFGATSAGFNLQACKAFPVTDIHLSLDLFG